MLIALATLNFADILRYSKVKALHTVHNLHANCLDDLKVDRNFVQEFNPSGNNFHHVDVLSAVGKIAVDLLVELNPGSDLGTVLASSSFELCEKGANLSQLVRVPGDAENG
ncbi:hypothetical protein N7490_004513 [Penicillium lividum]|nr:hypothetical protein N7490_004513 [Penicillium lividum]